MALTAIPQPYANGFQDPDELCLSYTRFGDGSGSLALTRADFARLSGRAASLLAKHECHHGTRILHCFGDNDWMDPVFRMGAAMLGAIPVAINWQADSLEQIVYKFEKPRASAIVFNESFDTELRANLISRLGTAVCIDTREILEETELPQPEGYRTVPGDTRLIVFTSGTTGNPKGVMLT
ncbi:MAG TPA: AMP-binding protein, partial [Spirochaetota bacterium]|nr:AMP-binding protein [Spirochaetota bacterium]